MTFRPERAGFYARRPAGDPRRYWTSSVPGAEERPFEIDIALRGVPYLEHSPPPYGSSGDLTTIPAGTAKGTEIDDSPPA